MAPFAGVAKNRFNGYYGGATGESRSSTCDSGRMADDNDSTETLRRISVVLAGHGDEALGGAAAIDVAREWVEAGFDDAEEVEDWLRARCFHADGARTLEMAGITPEQAAIRTRAGTSNDEETIGYKLTHGDLSFDEARRIITSEFWNS
jgi:hypothetical protein